MKRLSEIQTPLRKGKASSEQGSMVVEAHLRRCLCFCYFSHLYRANDVDIDSAPEYRIGYGQNCRGSYVSCL